MTDYTDAEKALIDATQWPDTEDGATADALIVHGARLVAAMHAQNDVKMRKAFALDNEDPHRKPALRAYMDGVTSMIAEAQLVIALAEVQKTSREQADALSRLLWGLTEDGGALTELAWEVLDARGIDADAVFATAEKHAEPGDPSPSGPASQLERGINAPSRDHTNGSER